MPTKTLTIKRLIRSPKTGDFDELNFEPGLNILVGPKRTGKTQWLRMLNYLMGDRGTVEDAFDVELIKKYESIKGVFLIDNEELTLERNWKQPGSKGKIWINGNPVLAENFSSEFLPYLNIPLLHYPKGNPFSPRSWPELSWATLLRHIYRRWKSWSELVYQQPEVEQHACLVLFLGIAEYLFSDSYEKLVDKQKEIYKKEIRKEEFINTLNQISRELLNEPEIRVAITANSIDAAIYRLDSEVAHLLDQRTEILDALKNMALENSGLASSTTEFEQLSKRWSKLQSSRAEALTQIQAIQSRLDELKKYSAKLNDELSRIERARSAGQIFRDLRVTHCPVCEQPVNQDRALPGHCYLCCQATDLDSESSNASEQRLDFEIEQLRDENEEAQDLINMVNRELKTSFAYQRSIDEELAYIQSRMQPIQTAASAIMPPEVSQEITQIDMDLGRVQERKRQLERVRTVLELQEDLSSQVAQIEDEISTLEAEVAELNQEINFEKASSFFTTQINNYLNSIKTRNPSSWMQGAVKLNLKEKTFNFTVEGRKISSLSATETLFFLPAYNYALLSLSNTEPYHYPGLVIFDFPPTFADGSSRADTENFILEPFIDLLNQPKMKNTQVIAVGSAFEGLESNNRIELTRVWH